VDATAALPSATLRLLHAALRDHLLVVIGGCPVTPEAQTRFTARFGPLARHPLSTLALAGRPEVVVEAQGGDDRDAAWHADLTWSPAPSRYSVLVAPEAGQGVWATDFANGVAAYARLDPWLKDRIEFLEVEHDHPRRAAAGLPPVVHPLVQVDPGTGRRALLLDGTTAQRIRGLPGAESDDLLHRLQAAATHPAIVVRHLWRAGDLVIWDNTALQHRSIRPAGSRLHRTMVAGQPPVGPRQLAMPWVSAG
jgi:taurine dioxygenase